MRKTPSRRMLAFAVALLVMVGCGRNHVQTEGLYLFTATQEISDDCGLLGAPDALWDGELLLSGDVMRMRYQLLDIVLAGAFLEVTEKFVLDGSTSGVAATLNGRSCTVDNVKVHIEAKTVSATEFEGPMQVIYETRNLDACQCELSVTYRATRN
jgi:hypothetical protein